MEDVTVSVIVPVYNVAQYLRTCLDSILRQDYGRLQIIIVNDGSTDSSPEICDAYAEKDSRVTVIHQKNAGLSAARNAGLDIANGKYAAFVDSDDFVSKEYISTMLQLMDDATNRIVCVGYKTFGDEKLIGKARLPAETQLKVYSGFEAIAEMLSGNYNRIGNSAWNKLYPLELFNGIRYPDGRAYEDLGTTYLLLEKCEEVIWSPQPLYLYRQRAGSIGHTLSPEFYKDVYELGKIRYLYLTKAYGDFEENNESMMNIIFGAHRYLDLAEKQRAARELDIILSKLHELHERPGSKTYVKYFLLKHACWLFCFLQAFNRKLIIPLLERLAL